MQKSLIQIIKNSQGKYVFSLQIVDNNYIASPDDSHVALATVGATLIGISLSSGQIATLQATITADTLQTTLDLLTTNSWTF